LQLKKTSKKVGSLKDKDGTTPMDIEDDDREQVEALARKFEEKYVSSHLTTVFLCYLIGQFCNQGAPTKQKKRKNKRSEDYVDLGAGYDDNDSFIDNTEVVSFFLLKCSSEINLESLSV